MTTKAQGTFNRMLAGAPRRAWLAFLILLLAAVESPAQKGQPAVFHRVFHGIAAPATSDPVPNEGQGLHLIVVQFAGETESISAGLSIRIEASFNGTNWFPISRDVTTATAYTPPTGTAFAYAIERANGFYPYVRVRCTATPADKSLTVWYSGGMQPLGQVSLDNGRYLPAAPTVAEARITWNLCPSTNCAVASNLTAPWIATRSGTINACYVAAKTAPVGSALIVEIAKNGTAAFTLTLPDGDTYEEITSIASRSSVKGDLYTISVTQIGTTTPGKDVNITCTVQ